MVSCRPWHRRLGRVTVQRSFDDLGTPLADVTFCVLDLETTGGDRADDAITEVGAVKVRGGECLGTFQTLVNPGRAIPPQITMLTGLTDALVAPAPRIEAVLPSLLEFLARHRARRPQHRLRRGVPARRRSSGPATRASTRCASTPSPSPAASCATRCPTAGSARWRRRLRLDHRPTHRALDDALATTDLLHLLIERASGLGVLGLDDLTTLASMAGHPQAAKLQADVEPAALPGRLPVLRPPRRGALRRQGDEPAPAGAQLLRPRGPPPDRADAARGAVGAPPLPARRAVGRGRRGSADRPSEAAVQPGRHARRPLLLRPPRRRLGVAAPRRSSRTPAAHRAAPRPAAVADDGRRSSSRRCRRRSRCAAARCGSAAATRRRPDATPCAAAQLGVAACPCAGLADRPRYDDAVGAAAAAMEGRPDAVVERLTDRMTALAAAQRFEEAAMARDRLSALDGAVDAPGRWSAAVARTLRGHPRRRHVGRRPRPPRRRPRRRLDRRRPAGRHHRTPPDPGRPLPRTLADEALVLARRLAASRF